jgi:hypothetical protein
MVPCRAMSPHVRRLTLFSLAGFGFVVLFGTIRSAPTPLKAWLAADRHAEEAIASFHAHFDALCWLGAAALAFGLHALDNLGQASRAPAWAPRAAASGYMLGSLAFSGGYAVKAFAHAAGHHAVVLILATALISLGGLFLIGAAACAALATWGARDAWRE